MNTEAAWDLEFPVAECCNAHHGRTASVVRVSVEQHLKDNGLNLHVQCFELSKQTLDLFGLKPKILASCNASLQAKSNLKERISNF